MDVLIPIFGVMIPIVAIIGGIGYQIFTRWQEGEEKRLEVQAANGGPELQARVNHMESQLTAMQAELSNTVRDMEERLARIEILLREVE